jgi:hypothetical protein
VCVCVCAYSRCEELLSSLFVLTYAASVVPNIEANRA